VLQRDAHQGQGQHGRHHVGEVIDEVDLPRLDLLVQAGPDQFPHHRDPAADGGGGQVRVERLAVLPLLGRVHLEEPALDHVLRGGNGDALVPAPLVVHVVVVGEVFGRTGQVEDLAVAGRDPVAAVGVAPCDGAPGLHLGGDLLEPVPVVRGVPVEVVAVLLAVDVAGDVCCVHAVLS
jgi:hypothetical protein